jgi:hypothetical protein
MNKLNWQWMIITDWMIVFGEFLFYRMHRSEYNDFQWIWARIELDIIDMTIFRVRSWIIDTIHRIECSRTEHQSIMAFEWGNGLIMYRCDYCDTWLGTNRNTNKE